MSPLYIKLKIKREGITIVPDIHFQYASVYIMNSKGRVIKTDLLSLMNSKPFKGGEVSIGIDQSTSAPGIAVFDSKDKMLLDIQIFLSSGNSTVNMDMFKEFLIKFFEGAKVKFLIAEEVVNVRKKSFNTKAKLKVLKEMVESMNYYSDSFKKTRIETINANKWRGAFITEGTQGRSRKDRKERVLQEAIRRNPAFENFSQYCGTDYDAIEAYGIYLGWKSLNFTEEGVKVLNSTMSKSTKYYYTPYYLREEDINEEFFKNRFGMKIPYYETELSVRDSAKVLANNFGRVGYFYPNESEEMWLALKIAIPLTPGFRFIIVAGRQS